jgi:hypothetical protein
VDNPRIDRACSLIANYLAPNLRNCAKQLLRIYFSGPCRDNASMLLILSPQLDL